MLIDIAESIREVLADRQVVTLKGVGTLELKHIPSTFSMQKKSLLPPRMDIVITDTVQSNSKFLKFLQRKYKISASKATEAFRGFTKKFLNAYINYGKVHIKGLGTFSKDEKGQVELDTTHGFTENYYKDYPEIIVNPIPRLKEEAEELKRIKQTLIPPTRKIEVKHQIESSVVPIPKADAPSSVVQTKTQLTDEKKTSTVIAPVAKVPEPKSSSVKPTKVVTKPTPYVHPSSEIKRSYVWPIISVLLFLLLISALVKGCNSLYSYLDSKTAQENKVATVLDGNTTEDSDSLLKSDDPTSKDGSIDGTGSGNSGTIVFIDDNGVEHVLPESGYCKIITGSFAKIANAIRMRELLEGLGYEVYTETYGRLTRVGFSFDCSDEDLRAYIQNVRREIEKQSWYLDPELHIEYE